jgi:elongation factor Ts
MTQKVTPDMVKKLRERTGVGMGKCKEALDQASGDMEKAIEFLRKAGMASAVKKEGRETNEGLIGSGEGNEAVALVEVNAETDFVTQNEKFKQFLRDIAHEAAESKAATLDALLQRPYSKDASITLDQHRALIMQSLGENIQVRRILMLPKTQDTSVGIYSHMGGKIVALVVLAGGHGQEALARDIAMHVAAEAPEYLRAGEIPQEVRIKEEDIARSQVTGKPEDIANRIVEGKFKAYCDEVCLLCQKYVKDNTLSVGSLLEKESQRLGKQISVAAFYRWNVGG